MGWQAFGTLAAGNENASLFDVLAAQIARNCVVICGASGANAITLTPDATNGPLVPSYNNLQCFSFQAAATNTTNVTVQVGSLAPFSLCFPDSTQITVPNTIIGNRTYVVCLSLATSTFILLNDSFPGQVRGSQTNDSALSGNIGEYIETAFGSAGITSNVTANVGSQVFPAGDWDLRAVTSSSGGATTTVNFYQQSISTTSATFDTSSNRFSVVITYGTTIFNFGSANVVTPLGPCRFSFATPTTVFLVFFSTFAVSTMAASGTLIGRRVR